MKLDVPLLPDAACKSTDADLWFAYENQGGVSKKAKAICATCPERLPCAQWAIDTVEPFGIWGGLSARDRQELRRQRPYVPPTVRQARTVVSRATTQRHALERAERARLLHQQGHTQAAIAHQLDVHERTVGRYIREAS